MTLVGAGLNLGKKLKICPLSADVLHKTSNLVISRCCFADGVQSYCFCPLNMQICDVLVAIAVRELKIYDDDVDDNARKQ